MIAEGGVRGPKRSSAAARIQGAEPGMPASIRTHESVGPVRRPKKNRLTKTVLRYATSDAIPRSMAVVETGSVISSLDTRSSPSSEPPLRPGIVRVYPMPPLYRRVAGNILRPGRSALQLCGGGRVIAVSAGVGCPTHGGFRKRIVFMAAHIVLSC